MPPQRQLIDSVIAYDLAGIDAALAQGADINALDPTIGRGALHQAAAYARFEAFKHLLERGADANAGYRHGSEGLSGNVLELLLSMNHQDFPVIQAMEMALKAGADANVAIPRSTLLHMATALGSRPVVELLLRHGADPMGRNGGGGIPLHTVFNANGSDVSLIFALARATPDLDARDDGGRPALHGAIERGREACVCCLLALGASPASVDFSQAIAERDWDARQASEQSTTGVRPQWLLNQAADCLKWLARSPLECAVATRETEVLSEVLERHDGFESQQVAAALSATRRRRLPQMESMILSWRARRCAHEALDIQALLAQP